MNHLALARVEDPSEEGPPPGRKLSETLRQLSRWVDLVAEEIDAIELGDYPQTRDIAARRATLEAELREKARLDETASFHDIYAAAVMQAVERVKEWTERERLTRDGLAQLHDGSLMLVREMPQVSQGGGYPVLEEVGGQLNVRL